MTTRQSKLLFLQRGILIWKKNESNDGSQFEIPIPNRDLASPTNHDTLVMAMISDLKARIAKCEADREADRANYYQDVKYGFKGELKILSAQMVDYALKIDGDKKPFVGDTVRKHVADDNLLQLAKRCDFEPDEFALKFDEHISRRNEHTHFDNQKDLVERVLEVQAFIIRHDYLLKDPDVGFAANLLMKYDEWQSHYPKMLAARKAD